MQKKEIKISLQLFVLVS